QHSAKRLVSLTNFDTPANVGNPSRVRQFQHNPAQTDRHGDGTMAKPVPRSVVEGMYKALAGADFAALAAYLADNVTWTISGPVDILPFCGRRSGKAVVLKLLDRDIPAFLDKRRMVPDVILIEGDRAAVFGRLTARRRDLGHASVTVSPNSSASSTAR